MPVARALLCISVLVSCCALAGDQTSSSSVEPFALDAFLGHDGWRRDAPLSSADIERIDTGLLSLPLPEQDRLLAYVEQRIGLEISPLGYALLHDRVRLARGEAQHYGAIPDIRGGRVLVGADAAIHTPRRLNLSANSIKAFHSDVQAALDAGVEPERSYFVALVLSSPRSVTKPDLRRALLDWASRDQVARESRDKDEANRVSRAATTYLKEHVERGGFPTSEEVGPAGVRAAWLLVQHAHEDVEFMKHCLSLVGDRLRAGDFSPVHFALLSDRVRILSGQEQLYATQMGVDANGMFYYAVHEPARLNERRRAVGLPPLSDERLDMIRRVHRDPLRGRPNDANETAN